MMRQSTTCWTARAYRIVLVLGLIFGTAAYAAERKDSRFSFEREQERLDHEERGLHNSFEADKKGLNQRCDREERALRERYRGERRRLDRELGALHDRCRDQRRALERNFESNKRALNNRREALRRDRRQDGRDLKHPDLNRGDHFEPQHRPDAKNFPPGLERYEEKHDGRLPPGLQKQREEKGKLPPGLEKR